MTRSYAAPHAPFAPASAPARFGGIVAGLMVAITVLFIGELSVGAVDIAVRDVVAALIGSADVNEVARNIVLSFRLPRALNALFCGAALGTAGLLLQTLFRNPLADPYVLGIVHGARLACAVLVTLAGVAGNALLLRFGVLGDIGLAFSAVLGSTAVLLLLSWLARRVNTVTLLVVGLMLGYLAVGLISVLLHFIDETQARAFKIWDDASFAGATLQQLRIVIPGIVIGLAASLLLFKPLNGLLLGDNYAVSMGVAVVRIRRCCLLLAGSLCGLVTAFCGPVAFLGLVAAQVARGLTRSADHAVLMPVAMLCGATLGLAADWVLHLPWSRHVFHLNAVIGLVGAPLALYMLLRRRPGGST